MGLLYDLHDLQILCIDFWYEHKKMYVSSFALVCKVYNLLVDDTSK